MSHPLFDNWIQNNKIPHAILLVGASLVEVAISFAKRLISSDHDLYVYRPEGAIAMHSLENIKQLINEANLVPYCSSKKVLIITDAERMLPTGANALLKTLEEPLSSTVIILTTRFKEKILPTLRSRCQIVTIDKEIHEEKSNEIIELLSHLDSVSTFQMLQQIENIANRFTTHEKLELSEELSALQKQSLEKQMEGKNALQASHQADIIWETILGWFRDLHLLHIQGNPKNLYHSSKEALLQQWVEKGRLPAFDLIQKKVDFAKLSYSRSGSLKLILESLFFYLKKITG